VSSVPTVVKDSETKLPVIYFTGNFFGRVSLPQNACHTIGHVNQIVGFEAGSKIVSLNFRPCH
jgi:hypothetical protein